MEWPDVASALARFEPPFPRAALEELRRRWQEWAPHLVAEVEHLASGGSPFRDEREEDFNALPFFGCWLAAEQRDVRFYRPLVAACHCDSERAELIFGDDLTDGLPQQLASLCDGDDSLLKALAEDDEAAMWCRYAALKAMQIRVVEGDADVDALREYLENLCEREAEVVRRGAWDYEREPFDLFCMVVDLVGALGPGRMMARIRAWFDEDLIDPTIADPSHYEEQAAKSTAQCLAEARDDRFCHYVTDAIADMAWWACFDEDAKATPTLSASDDDDDFRLGGDSRALHPGTFRRETPKVGRNNPCPCGSGKKFKKCCGAQASS